MSCRTAAAAFNLSSFCKLKISGPDAKHALEWICTNDIDQPANTYALHLISYLLINLETNI